MRFTILVHYPLRGAPAVREALTARITTLPEQLRRSLTWDQGPRWPSPSSQSTPAGRSTSANHTVLAAWLKREH
jgi:hypothetical protein